MRPPDLEERAKAVLELDKNVLVLAGAGTGKTSLLIERFCRLILEKGVPLEQIVALTFTRKAAEEMRDRLEKKLRQIMSDPDSLTVLPELPFRNKPLWPQRAKTALDNMAKGTISTIHSFAIDLLKLYPLQARVDPKFRPDESALSASVLSREWSDWLAEELGSAGPRASLWRQTLAAMGLEDLRRLGEALVSPAVEIDSIRLEEDVSPLARAAAESIDRLKNEYPLGRRNQKFSEKLDNLRDYFESFCGAERPEARSWRPYSQIMDSPPKLWEEAAPLLKELEYVALSLNEIDAGAMRLALDVLAPYVRRARNVLHREGIVTFDGLLVFARNLVRDHPFVREALKNRFATFLVDEFQDTDPLQGEIIFYLAETPGRHASDWKSVELGPGRLFVVGDPKQAIYRFRGADIAAYEAFRKRMLETGALEAELTANFRSRPAILACVNDVIAPSMKREPYVQPAFAPLTTTREDVPWPAVEIHQMTFEEGTGRLKADPLRASEAEVVADWVKNAIQSGRIGRYKDVALLFRNLSGLDPYLAAFKRRGIPYQAEGEKYFYESIEVTDLMNLLSLVVDPNDTRALAAVLRSPLGGLTDAELARMAMDQKLTFRTPPPMFPDKLRALYATVFEMHRLSPHVPVPELIRRLLAETRFLEIVSQSFHGEQAIANIQRAVRLAEDWIEKEPMTLKEFVLRFDEYEESNTDVGENPLTDVHADAVAVMTVHKAKGLEFPVVLLPGLGIGRGPNRYKARRVIEPDWRTGAVGVRLLDAGKSNAPLALVESDLRKRDQAEEIRVFYVALTRAKENLVLFLRDGNPAGPAGKCLQRAGAWPDSKIETVSLPSVSVPLYRKLYAAPSNLGAPASIPSHLGKEWEASSIVRVFEARRRLEATYRQSRRFSSPSMLMREAEKEWPREEPTTASRERAVLLGLLCHKVMEWWDYASPAKTWDGAVASGVLQAARALELRVDLADHASVIREATEMLIQYVASPVHRKISGSNIVGKEIPFLYASPMDPSVGGTGVMRGVIDLLYETEDGLIVADFKTNQLTEKNRAGVLKKYAPQSDVYLEAVRRAYNKQAIFELIFLRESKSFRLGETGTPVSN